MVTQVVVGAVVRMVEALVAWESREDEVVVAVVEDVVAEKVVEVVERRVACRAPLVD